MCIALYPPAANESVTLELVMERIYQRRNGGTIINVDLLLKNISAGPWIDRLRLVVPFAIVRTSALKKVHDEDWARKKIRKLREKQLRAVSLLTHELSQPRNPANWIYEIVPHLSPDHAGIRSGRFALHRYEPNMLGDAEATSGFIKNGWELQAPEQIDDWTWLMLAQFGAMIVDKRRRPELPTRC
jgi:hypothetical protein